ncbi:hypothetical protein [Pusillimonas sp. ANT_WB101]|uniref:hypothetical protein n=1 Tax=Pusillimonas sp. ANT_WB101 TaxID=2597356 RepID=UPI0011F06E3E|nr:hypothetical protein [Pusillimonas sp. ANT_WB101]KAA0889934.1 hypothetical protein FQ179_16385 [Pusillimonas sp. ANT_WB101]
MKKLANVVAFSPNVTRLENDLRSQIANVMAQYPDLSAYGFHFSAGGEWDDLELYKCYRDMMLTSRFADEVLTCIEAIYAPRARWEARAWRLDLGGSYGLKHAVERWVREGNRDDLASYISNGAFIVAAVIEGWVPVRSQRSPNCRFAREGKR